MTPTIKGTPARLVACCTASSAFTVAVLAGMFAGNDLDSTVTRALAAMVVCYVVGRVVGGAMESIVAERVAAENAGSHGAPGAEATRSGAAEPSTTTANRTRAA